MDSVVNAAVEEICGGIEDGVTLAGLWEKLQGSPSFSSTNLNLNRNVKRALWTNLLRIPVLRFEPPPSSSELEDAENLNLKVFPQSSLVHNFLGLYESQSIQHAQTRVLHLLAKARRNGITQTRLAKRLNIDANKFHYVLRSLECRGLIVKRSAIERKKRISSFGESENYSSVTTNLVFLRCYAKHLADGTTFQTDVHLKDDYSPQMKAVCDKLAKAKGKVLLVSDIRKDLGYCGFRPKRRAWNQITQRLNADGIVEQFFAKVNGKIETCLQLLDPITAGSGNEDKKLNSGKTCQVIDQLVELPTEHQIFDIIDAAGSCGITLKEICERLGIELKKSTIPFVDFCGRFKMIVREEQCLKSKTYRVWSSNFKLEPEIELKPELVASTASEELAGHANFSLSVDDTQRANRILERLKDERFILKPELNRWLSSFEKDKPTKVDPNTIDGILSILKKQVLVKCIKVYSPVIFEYLSTKVCVVVRPSTSLSPELFDEIEDRIRTFLPRKSTSHQKNDELILVMEDIQKNQSVIVPDGQVLSMYSCKRRRHFVSQFKDEEKQDNSPEGMGDSSCRRKNKFTELRPAKHARIDALTDVVDMHIEQSHNLDVQSGDCATGMEEFEGSTPEDCTPLINQGVLKKMKPTRRRRFSWSNKTERQLVIQYVKHRAVLGAKSRVYWKSISDLPTSPTACMERMTLLNGNLRFRTAVNKLCNILSERYAKHLQKYQNMSLNSDECKQFVRSQPYEGISNNSPDVEIQTRSLNREAWDDFENKTIKTALEEILRCKIIAKLDASSQKGQMQYEGCSDASLNADGYESQENAEITSAIPCEIVRSHRGKAHSLSSQRSRRQRLDKKFTGFLKNMANVYGQVNESLAISNAVELFKLVFLSTSTGPQPPNLLADILHRYSEHDLFAAFNYLREKKIMVGGTGSERFELSQQFLQSVSKSPFPFNTGKQAVKFAAWLKERGEDLTEGGAKISEDLKCGDIFHLFALVSSGDILILPSLPDNGVGEAEDLRSAKRKFDAIESSYGDKAKKSKSLFGVEGEIISRREKGFPGIAISAYQTTISKADILNFFKDNDNNGQPFRGHLQLNIGQSCDYFLCDYMLEIVKSCDPKPLEENHTESPWEAMAGYARRLLLEYSNQEHGYGICAEVFKVVYAAIQKAGDQGLSMGEISKIINLPGAKVDGLIVDALQAFGKTLKVNAYDTVCVVDVLYRHKYFLPSHFRHDVQPSSRKTIEKSDLTCEHYESDKRDTSSVHTLSDRKITIDNAEGVTINQACDRNESCKQDRLGLCRVNHQKETLKFSLGESCMPILPWINGNGTINNIVYRGLRRRVLGIVMQNPGMLEDDILRHMHVLNPQSCRTLLEMMVLDKHLVVRKMHQNIFDGGPTVLQYLIGSKSSQPKLICREHFFPNPMSTALL
ncbi:uncharacterized protein [Phaseolus vulgaris]